MRDEIYFSHSANANGHKELLSEHLICVSEEAVKKAAFFDADYEALIVGYLHDLGKYGRRFQRRLSKEESGIDHWSIGAWVALMRYQQKGIAAALAIQGHHTGLQAASADALRNLNPKHLQQNHPLNLKLSEADMDVLLLRLGKDGISLPTSSPMGSIYGGLSSPPAAAMLDVRMLYSALVDADFIATEAHFNAAPGQEKTYREEGLSLKAAPLLSVLLSHIYELTGKSKASPALNEIRTDLLKSCLANAEQPSGIFTLTAPTGAGKTLSMLAFALKHASVHKRRRIVIVLPYLSIIEQTAKIYKEIFRKAIAPINIDKYILEHHSLAGLHPSNQLEDSLGKDMEDEDYRAARILSENWDAPIVITTSVQFLESLFSNRPFACRKLHNLAKSVILFDEVQTIPNHLVVPTLATLGRLAEKPYEATVVFSTATQPAFDALNEPVKKLSQAGWKPREIVPEQRRLFRRVRRTVLEWLMDINQPLAWSELSCRVAENEQALCIVNLKRHAHRILDELEDMGVETSLFHLSTNMCPAHRQLVLTEVRRRLKNNESCILISTQCVEAGVDVDFPVVFRALGPLDAIAQAAGRCNRNGLAESGRMIVFLPEEEAYPDPAYRQATGITKLLYRRLGKGGMDINDTELFDKYYREMYSLANPGQRRDLTEAILRQDFVETSRHYYLIPKATVNVLVPFATEPYDKLAEEVRRCRLNKAWTVKAAPHSIGIYRPSAEAPIRRWLEPVPVGRKDTSDDWFIYLRREHYDSRRGLMPPESLECIIA
ncbi:MAG: CRISPR-associated helicase Cas3' [Pseudomonadota bacterium]|nr:CRISPR-associated helicase Cas3' [Pseudomonadota bacterium]